MFSGTYTPKLDEKGRLFLPAKFRDEMKEGLVITRGQEHALDIRTRADFAVFTEKFQNHRRPTPGSGPTAGCCSRWPPSRSPTSRAA